MRLFVRRLASTPKHFVDEEVDLTTTPLLGIVIELCEGRRLVFKQSTRSVLGNELYVYADPAIIIKPLQANTIVLRVVELGE